MKISQEVRDFALKNPPRNGAGATAQAVTRVKLGGRVDSPPSAHPEPVEGPTLEEAKAGMAVMSERYREGGIELYIGAVKRDRDGEFA